MNTLTTDEVSKLTSNDVACLLGKKCTIAESGEYLEGYYHKNSREVSPGSKPEYGRFWDKVNEIAEILKGSDKWPLPPIMVQGDTLYDGHHRANAALKVGWNKPIPTTTEWIFW